MRTLRADFAMDVPAPATFTMLALPSSNHAVRESLALAIDGGPVEHVEEEGRNATRVVRFATGPGILTCAYAAEVDDGAAPVPSDDDRYLHASRYVEVDELRAFAAERFGAASSWDAVDAVRRWTARSLTYDMYMSEIDDTAAATMRKRGGMCRDFTHVVIGLCRALGIPARYASVYAPGLTPPDFHAVAEVRIDDAWWVIDATGLAPRRTMVRIATGVDAEETAWLTNSGATVSLRSLQVQASDDTLAAGERDDPTDRIALA